MKKISLLLIPLPIILVGCNLLGSSNLTESSNDEAEAIKLVRMVPETPQETRRREQIKDEFIEKGYSLIPKLDNLVRFRKIIKINEDFFKTACYLNPEVTDVCRDNRAAIRAFFQGLEARCTLKGDGNACVDFLTLSRVWPYPELTSSNYSGEFGDSLKAYRAIDKFNKTYGSFTDEQKSIVRQSYMAYLALDRLNYTIAKFDVVPEINNNNKYYHVNQISGDTESKLLFRGCFSNNPNDQACDFLIDDLNPNQSKNDLISLYLLLKTQSVVAGSKWGIADLYDFYSGKIPKDLQGVLDKQHAYNVILQSNDKQKKIYKNKLVDMCRTHPFYKDYCEERHVAF